MFQPNPTDLQQICELLASSQLADNQKQKQVFDLISSYSKTADFYHYLAYILSSKEFPGTVRRIAGLSLKSAISQHYEMLQDFTRDYIKERLLEAFNDQDAMIRNASALVITTLIFKGGFQNWPNLLTFFQANLASSQSLELVESTIDCVAKIIEDLRVNCENYDFFDPTKGGTSIDGLIPNLLGFCDQVFNERIRQAAIFCLNLCIFSMPPSLSSNIGKFMEVLLTATQNPNEKIRLRGFQGLVSLNETRPDYVEPRLEIVLQRVITGMKDSDYEVARNAISFWMEFLLYDLDSKEKLGILTKYLPQLLETLLDCLRYAPNDLMNLLPEETAGKDIRTLKAGMQEEGEEEIEEIEAEDEKEKKDGLFGTGEFTIRRVAGQTLEKLAEVFRDEVFKLLQFKINQCLRDSDWKVKESAILCIGALAEGCYESIKPHLSFILLFLLQNISDKEPLIKTISCWTLSRFTSFIIENANQNLPETQDSLLKAYLREILKAVMDANPTVQEAACSAFSSLVSKAAHMLFPFLYEVFQVFAMVFEHYKGTSLFNLYGAISSIFESLEGNLQDLKPLEMIIPRLMEKFNNSLADDKNLCPLMECLISISTALGRVFVSNYPLLFNKSLQIINTYLVAMKQGDKKTEHDKRELFLRVVDLLSSMLEILKQEFDSLIINSNLYPLLVECLDDKDFQVRQFVFSFLGEVAKSCPKGLFPYVEALFPILLNNVFILPPELDPGQSYISICNNAVWALGEFSMNYPEIIKPQAFVIAERVIQLMTSNKLQRTLAGNFAKCLGRMALLESGVQLSAKLEGFIKHWCLIMKTAQEDIGKQQAFKGFFLMVERNPKCFYKYFQQVCESFAGLDHPEEELKGMFTSLIKSLKAEVGQEAEGLIGRLAPSVKEKLKPYLI